MRSSTVPAVIALASLLAATACESSTEPAEDLAVTLEFNIARPAFFPDFSNSRTGGTLLVRGRAQTLCQPAQGTAEVARQGDALVLTVTVTGGPDCAPGQGVTGYDATITGFNSIGRLRVVHRWPGSDLPDAVAWESVWD
jgi:hypothetical protein